MNYGYLEKDSSTNTYSYSNKIPLTDDDLTVIRGNSIYTIVEGPTWEEAEANANKLGGHLVTINDAEENQWLVDTFASLVTYNGKRGDSSSNDSDDIPRAWIGLNDKETEGIYEWVSGEEITYRGTLDSGHFSGMSDTFGRFDPETGLRDDSLPLITAFIDQDVSSIQLGDFDDNFWFQGSWEDTWGNYTHYSQGIAETPIILRGDSAYVLVDGPTWEEAEANANKLGGHLVTINDAEENQWLYSNFGGGNWIGITDKDTEGDWKWISGDDVDYTNWYQGQPSNSIHLSTGIDQDFGWMHTDWLGEWDDHFASNDVGTSATHGIAEIKVGETITTDSGSGNNIVGYVNGSAYTGDFHVMADGTKMTGASHGAGTDQIIYSTITEK